MAERPGADALPRWFSKTGGEVLSELESEASGLASAEANKRLRQFGPNEVVREKPKSALFYFSKQINQPLIYVLLAAAIVTGYLGEWADTAAILVVVAVNATIGFIQESKAGRAIEELLKYSVTMAKVKRDGVQAQLPAKGLVPGDVVILLAGDMIPADIRFLIAKDLFVDESVFTGESQPVLKESEPMGDRWFVPADQVNMGFFGTFVVRGRAEAVVVATGRRTEISKITQELKETKKSAFPMMKRIEELARFLTVVVALAAIFTLAVGLIRGYEAVYMFRASVALAVAAIPEGLPALVTVVLASGVRTMAKRNAIVRSLPAVEALGGTTVICSDKTGTLTMNRMTVVKVHAGGRDFDAEPPTYSCVRHCDYPGPVSLAKERNLYEALAAGMMCNDAVVKDGKVEGEPTETALLDAAFSAGVRMALMRLDEIPFETRLGYMATLHQDLSGNVIFAKGAPESIIRKCTSATQADRTVKADHDLLLREVHEMAEQALRVLAVAMKRVPSDKKDLSQEDIADLTFLGLIGLLDPLRPETKEAVSSCRKAGIRVIMITGDHAVTARAIADDLGLLHGGPGVVTGQDMQAMSDAELRETVRRTNVFARTTPEHKLRIIEQLTGLGEIVAVTGDGVNDTPALKAASIGIAMGISGTDAARETADIVLKDDNFATIVSAVEEGRDIYSKVQKIIAWIIPTSIGEALILLLAIVLGTDLPLTPLQILWINLVTAVALATPLAFEPKESGLLQRLPRAPGEKLITRAIVRKFVIVSALMVAGTFGAFNLYEERGRSVEVASTVALNTLVFFEMFYLFNGRSLTDLPRYSSLTSNRWLYVGVLACFISQLAITYLSPLNDVFRTDSLGLVDWLSAALIASTVFFAIEIEKGSVRFLRSSRAESDSVHRTG
jgi:magnesium-transporting ATPase (P-type)